MFSKKKKPDFLLVYNIQPPAFRRRYKGNIKIDSEEIWCDVMFSILPAQGRVRSVTSINGKELSVS